MEKNLLNKPEVNELLFSHSIEQLILHKNKIISFLQDELKRRSEDNKVDLSRSFKKIEEENRHLKIQLSQLSDKTDTQKELLQKIVQLETEALHLRAENSFLKKHITAMENQPPPQERPIEIISEPELSAQETCSPAIELNRPIINDPGPCSTPCLELPKKQESSDEEPPSKTVDETRKPQIREIANIPAALPIWVPPRSLWLIPFERRGLKFSPFIQFREMKKVSFKKTSFCLPFRIKTLFKTFLTAATRRSSPIFKDPSLDSFNCFEGKFTMIPRLPKFCSSALCIPANHPVLSPALFGEASFKFVKTAFPILGKSLDFYLSYLFNTIRGKFIKQVHLLPLLIHSIYLNQAKKPFDSFFYKKSKVIPNRSNFRELKLQKSGKKIFTEVKFSLKSSDNFIARMIQSTEESLSAISSMLQKPDPTKFND
ncbi:hypothetical protein HYY75_06445 [bacterium]|nr:hypothetical protein [bacterium]